MPRTIWKTSNFKNFELSASGGKTQNSAIRLFFFEMFLQRKAYFRHKMATNEGIKKEFVDLAELNLNIVKDLYKSLKNWMTERIYEIYRRPMETDLLFGIRGYIFKKFIIRTVYIFFCFRKNSTNFWTLLKISGTVLRIRGNCWNNAPRI